MGEKLKSSSTWTGAAFALPLVVLSITTAPPSARAVTGDTVDSSAEYVLPVVVGDLAKGEDLFGCSGTLIERDWALTSAACLRESGAAPVSAASAPLHRTAFGRYSVLDVTLHPTRDLALLHLDTGDTGPGTTQLSLASAPAAEGETLRVVGAGRTGTQWLPAGPHAGSFTVRSAADAIALTATGDTSVCPGDAGGPVVREVAGVPKLVAIMSTAAQVGCLGSTAEQGHAATAARVDDLGPWVKSWTGNTGFESSDPVVVPNIVATSGGVSGVVGISSSVAGPELGVRTERPHSGAQSLLYSGKDNSTTKSYAYLKVAEVPNIPVDSRSVLEYWIYPAGGTGSQATGSNSSCVAVDLDFTDGTLLRNLKAPTSAGVEAHPAKQCGHLTLNTWNRVRVGVGRVAAGKRIKQVNVGYDQTANTGGYRGFIDDISLYHGCVPPPGMSCTFGGSALTSQTTTAPASPSDVRFDDPAPVAEQSIVDNNAYPGAARILTEQHVKIISGDGHMLLADCSVPTTGKYEYIRVRTSDLTVGARGQLCFRLDTQIKFGTLKSTAMLKLEVPGAYSVRSDGYEDGVGHNINVVWRVGDEPARMAPVPQNGYLSIGIADPDGTNRPATVLQLLVLP